MSNTNKKTALILGGTDDHIHLINKLKARGYQTMLVDYLENPPAKNTADIFFRENALDKDVVLKIAQQNHVDLVIATCIDQALPTMAYVCELMNLPCHISYKQALSITNKALMKNTFLSNNIPTSRFVILEKEDQFDHSDSELQFPLVIKPCDANSSKGISKVYNHDGLKSAIEGAFNVSNSKKIVVEEYFDGDELSVDVVIRDYNADIVMISRNHKNRNNTDNFTIVQNYFNSDDYNRFAEPLKIISENIARSFSLNNVPLLLQVLVKDDTINVIEFSSRIGGGSKHLFIRMNTGFDILEYFVNVIINRNYSFQDIKFGSFRHSVASVNYVYTCPGIFHSVEGIEYLKNSGIIEDFVYYKTFSSRICQSLSSNDRVGGFFVKADDLDDHDVKCRKADSVLKVIEMENGSDIMLHGLYFNNINSGSTSI